MFVVLGVVGLILLGFAWSQIDRYLPFLEDQKQINLARYCIILCCLGGIVYGWFDSSHMGKEFVVATSSARIRKLPQDDSTTVGILENASLQKALEEKRAGDTIWYKIGKNQWVNGKDCDFSELAIRKGEKIKADKEARFKEKEQQEVAKKKRFEESKKRKQEEIRKYPLVEEHWTESDMFTSYVVVEVSNRSDEAKNAYIKVRFYQNGAVRGELSDSIRMDPNGTWVCKFPAAIYVDGAYEYKVDLKETIF